VGWGAGVGRGGGGGGGGAAVAVAGAAGARVGGVPCRADKEAGTEVGSMAGVEK